MTVAETSLRFPKPRPARLQIERETDWTQLNGESYKKLSPLLKTHHGLRVDADAAEANRFVQYTKEELEADHLVTVQDDGLLCIGTAKKIIHTMGEGLIFVMHQTGRIYATSPVAGSIFHSSLCIPGDPDFENPIAPGTLNAKDGVPIVMKEDSGHFAPKNCLPYVMAKLFADGCKWIASCRAILSPHAQITAEQRTTPDSRRAKLDAILAAKQSSIRIPLSATERKESAQDDTPVSTPSPLPRERQSSNSPSQQQARKLSELTSSGKLSRDRRLARVQTQLIQEAAITKTNTSN